MRTLESYSNSIESAPKRLRALIEADSRIVAFTIEPDGCFIYTNTAEWDDGNGSGTFREDTVTAAIKAYKSNVTRNTAGRF